MSLLIRTVLAIAAMLAALVIAPETPAFGIVEAMTALALITAVIGALAFLERRRR